MTKTNLLALDDIALICAWHADDRPRVTFWRNSNTNTPMVSWYNSRGQSEQAAVAAYAARVRNYLRSPWCRHD